MNKDLISLVILILIALSVAGSAKQKEICDCVPLNICPKVNRFSKEDAKYFKTILKCKERGFVRCCFNNESVRRSDDLENIILIDNVRLPPTETTVASIENMNDGAQTTEAFTEVVDSTTIDAIIESTTSMAFDEDLATTELLKPDEEDLFESKRKSEFIDNNISVVYPNLEHEKKMKALEHLFLIFPNGEIEAASATSIPVANDIEQTTVKPMKRVIVRKRLIKKLPDLLETAESKISQSVIDTEQMDVEEVKRRLTSVYRNNGIKHQSSSRSTTSPTTTTTTTEVAVEDTTAKRERKKKIKYRKRNEQTSSTPLESTTAKTTTTLKNETPTTKHARRKIKPIIYDTRSRSNFLKRPSSQQSYFEDANIFDEPIELEPIITTTTAEPTSSFISFETASLTTTTTPKAITVTTPKPIKHFSEIDFEHKAMIETVHKTLSAIHAGVDINLVEKMLEAHRIKMKENRQRIPTTRRTPTTTGPFKLASKPYRGSARFRKPAKTTQAADHSQPETNGTRTRNLSRTRNTTTKVSLTTLKPVRSSNTRNNPTMKFTPGLEDVDMPPKQKPPRDFKASPLFGLTMDRDSEIDIETIQKIHETLRPSANIQNGFFPVIQNGTPSSLI